MKDFDDARIVARNLNAVLQAIFNNIGTGKFNSNIDFSNISSATLKDFIIYTAGFIGFKNNEELDSLLSREEITQMLAGKFKIKYLTENQLKSIAKNAGVSLDDEKESEVVPLYTIQDGTYYLNKNIYDKASGQKTNFVSLITNPVELHTDIMQFYYEPKAVIRALRNTFAHESPYINGNKLTFLNFSNDEDAIVVSKMWLRGYTELFARKSMPFSPQDMSTALLNYLKSTTNTLSSNEEIDQALDSIQELFPERLQDSFHTYKFLIKERLRADPRFYKKSVQDKVQTLSSLTCNNPSLFNSKNNSSSSQVMYNLQNLIGLELKNRNEEAPLDESDPDIIEFANILQEIDRVNKGLKIIENLKSMQGKSGKTYKKKQEELSYLRKRASNKISLLNPKKLLETAHMELLAFEDLENLPVEIAVNVVYLLAFNNLVSSGFYEEVLRYSDFQELSPAQEEFFNSFDFGSISYSNHKNGNKFFSSDYRASDKAFILYSMRNALCHGNLTYSIPKQKDNIELSYKNVLLHFDAEKQGISIRGRLKDFYNLLNSPNFTNERDDDLKTYYNHGRIKKAEARRKTKTTSNNNDDSSQPT